MKRVTRRLLNLTILSIMMILITCSVTYATIADSGDSSIVDGGKCGESVYWTLDDKGVLTISGTGAMKNYGNVDSGRYIDVPWYEHRFKIYTVVIEEGVTSIDFEGGGDLWFTFADTFYIPDSCTGVTNLSQDLWERSSYYSSSSPIERAVVYCNSTHEISNANLGSKTKIVLLDAPAEESVINGSHGNIIQYQLNKVTGVLTITSSKEMAFPTTDNTPWTDNDIIGYVRHIELKGSFNEIPNSAFECDDNQYSGSEPNDIYSAVRTITLSDNITTIGNRAFSGCERMYRCELPNNVQRIGQSAFSDTIIEKIEIPASVKTIEPFTFSSCDNLSEVILHEGLERIEKYAFSSCDKITQIELPDSLVYLCGLDGTGISELNIPEGVKTVGYLRGCKNLKELIIPEGVETIIEGFEGCTSLETLVIPDSVTEIIQDDYSDSYGFLRNCSNLKAFEIPSCLTYFDFYFFYGCASLEEIIIPPTVTFISDSAFRGCTNLKRIVIPYTIDWLNQDSFNGCESLEEVIIHSKEMNIPENLTFISPKAVIHGFTGSAAETYANTYGHTFISLDNHQHMWTEFETTVTQTCSREGEQTRICTICGENEIEKMAKLPHTEVLIKGKAATCTEEGLTDGKECSVCDVTIVKRKTIPAKGHSEKTIAGKAATCTETGLTDGKKCEVCGTVTVKQKVIKAKGHKEKTTTTKATTSKNGKVIIKCTTCKKTLSTKTVYAAKTVKLKTTEYTYDSKVKSPTLIIKDGKGKTISSKNYTVTKQSGRKNVGKYYYKIKFKNQYSGSKTLYLTINPKAPAIKKPVAAKKAITVKWSKLSKTQATGYEIMIATNKKFTKGKKTVKVTKATTTSKKITKLKAKKTYYAKVRTYKTVNGKKYYSAWSSVKTVKTL